MIEASEPGQNAPLVTIVLPCGPDANAALQSLRSVRAQTVRSVEILAFNDGCSEADFAALTSQAGGHIEAIGGSEGTACAWNAAVRRSAAPYICFLQAGDEIEQTYLEKCLFLLEVAPLDVCGSWQMDGAELRRTGPFSLRALLERDVTGSAVIRRETLIRSGGFDGSFAPPLLMWDLWIRMAENGARGHSLPEPLVYNSSQLGDKLTATASLNERQLRLRRDHSLVERLDVLGTKLPALSNYTRLLEGAREADAPGILVAMPYLTMGGAERSMAGVLPQLTRRGHRVFLVTTEAAPHGCGDTSHWFRGNIAGTYQLPRFIVPRLWPAFIAYLIQRHSIRILLQVGSPSTYSWLPHLKELFGELAVVDLLFNPVGHFGSYRKSSGVIDHVIVEHEGMAAWLVKHGERRDRISVIPNAVDTDRFAPQPPGDWRTGGPRREGTFVVGFFGRLAEEKAPDVFLRIAARFKQRPAFQFLICGTGPMEASLRAMCQKDGLEESVHFLGFVDTREYLPCCHLTVTCSRLDGRPNIILESLAMGVPVVASRVGGIPEMAAAGKGIELCEPADEAGFCAAIERLAADKEGYRWLAGEARRCAETQYSMAGAAGEYAKLFQRLASARHRPARSAEEDAAIAAAVLPACPPYRPLPSGRLRASLHILRDALRWRNAPGTFRTIRQYVMMRRRRAARRELAVFFDARYYALLYPDVKAARISPLWHYLLAGFRNGCNPSLRFDTEYYLGTHPDVAAAGINPLIHYLSWGRAEGRTCLPDDSRWSPAPDAAMPEPARGAGL